MPLQPNNDVIYLITKMNASDNAFSMQHRLTTTRNMSQVCRQWREVVLASPLIWGRLILLDKNQSSEWIGEVLKRAGSSSPLWIELRTDHNTPPKEHRRLLSSLSEILQDLEMIEALHIVANSTSLQEGPPSYSDIWEHISKPAPILRSFCVTPAVVSVRHQSALSHNLFMNHAPLLRRLSCYGLSLDSIFQWTPHLVTLDFSPNSVDDIENVLISAPHLRILGITARPRCFQIDTQATLSKLKLISGAILRRLTYIEGSISLSAFNALWSTSPSASAKYTTQLWIHNERLPVDQAKNEEQLPKTLSNFYHHHNLHADSPSQPTRWSLIIRSLNMHIRVLSSSKGMDTPLDLRFFRGISPNTDKFLLECFASYFSNAMDFTLDMHTPRDRDSPLKYVGNLLLQMTEVTTINVRENSFGCYNQIEKSTGLLFPKLKMVKCTRDVYGSQEYKDQFLLFFQKRAKVRRVLPSIYTGKTNNDEMIRDLNKICGPQVRWALNDKWSNSPELHCKYV